MNFSKHKFSFFCFLLLYFFCNTAFSQNDSVYFGGIATRFKINLKTNLDSAKILALKIDKEAKERNYQKGMGIGKNYLGICFIYEGKYDSALIFLNQALKLYGEKQVNRGLCDVYSNIGVCYDYLGKYPEAIKNYLKAAKIAEIIKDDDAWARASNNLGTILYQQKNFVAALNYFEKSLKIREKEKDVYGVASCCLNIAACLSNEKSDEKANYFLSKAIKNAEAIADSALLADAYTSLGQNYRRQKEYNKAIALFNKSLPIYIAFSDKRGQSDLYHELGLAYSERGNVKLAHSYFLNAFDLAKSINYVDGIQDAASGLIVTSAKLRTDSVDYFLHQYSDARDSIFSENNSKLSAEMQSKYESDKKDQEIKMKDLTISNQEIESQKKSFQRNAFVVGFILMLGLSFFIYRSYRQKKNANIEISRQKEIISNQKFIVEEKNKEITDSITYAQRIQSALLAGKTVLDKNLNDYFILFKPKDIVSGDFYWATEAHGKFYFIVADSTGHGVPGAFMSLLNISFLNEAINEKGFQKTNEILAHVRQQLILNLSEDGSNEGGQDGMDCSLMCLDIKNNRLYFSGANNSIYILRNDKMIELNADRIPVGKSPKENQPFTEHKIELQKNDIIYAFTDGYPDQFGGQKGKKFKHKNLVESILIVSSKKMSEQKTELEKTFTNWKGNLEQLDDVLVVGIKT